MEIINIGNTFYTNYVLRFEKNVILIDCGYNCSYKTFLKKIAKHGVELEDIKVVLLTHVHQDHVSYMEELLKNIKPILIVGKGAIDLIKLGEDQFYYFTSKQNRKLTYFTAKLRGGPASWNPFDIEQYNPVVVEKDDSETLKEYNATIYTLPGHTADSIGLRIGDDFFVGDAIMNCIPAKNLLPLLISSADDFKASYEKMVNLASKRYFSGHGKVVDLEKLKSKKQFVDAVVEY